MKQNCWEFRKCQRQPGGKKEAKHGACPAATYDKYDGLNGGKNGGRHCWKMIAEELSGFEVKESFVNKLSTCLKCDFFKQVCQEEGDKFVV